MALTSLQLLEFRNIQQAQLDFDPQWNLIYGANGSGKTSLLEAIYLLAHGRSFRTAKPHKVIRHEQNQYTLFARVDWSMQHVGLGMQRDRQRGPEHVTRARVQRMVELAQGKRPAHGAVDKQRPRQSRDCEREPERERLREQPQARLAMVVHVTHRQRVREREHGGPAEGAGEARAHAGLFLTLHHASPEGAGSPPSEPSGRAAGAKHPAAPERTLPG